jgi:hypothetical protein
MFVRTVKDELLAKLQNESAIEEDMREDEDLSANIKEYIESSAYEVSHDHCPPAGHRLTIPRSKTSRAITRSS